MRIAFLGLGLIGGSVARAVRASGAWPDLRIAAWTPGGRGPAAALAAGVVDEAAASPEAAIDGAGVVVLAAPPLACLDLLDRLAGPWRVALRSDAVVTDVASTKAAICERAASHGLRFVGGHPMAGREVAGFEGADASLFAGRPWVVVPPDAVDPDRATDADAEAVATVEALALACGARPLRLTAAEHDAAVAAVSHLPLVLAAALVEAVAGGAGEEPAPDWPVARALAASGWRDMTRLARGDVEMGTGIAATNAAALRERIHALRDVIDRWLVDLGDGGTDPDPGAIAERLQSARRRLIDGAAASVDGDREAGA